MKRGAKTLIIGYGNPGRLDDGLGPALAAAIEALNLEGVTVESNYQLNVEDAELIAQHDVVIFADAAVDRPAPFAFERVKPRALTAFTTHHVDPQTLLNLAHTMFAAKTVGYMIGIRGYAFNEFEEKLSDAAQRNLQAAVDFVHDVLDAPAPLEVHHA